ncbi:winged helix-turn-helix domain-containing protein [Streptomyces sp. NPDC005485]|uniref:winged helix-turn-helix domain-containing protein n=1 Tax=Streptomyces sp. NPDC005485 TaxID=3155591 RepID=UPI0033A81943
MPIRIHFTTEDMARTCFVEAPRPFLELNIALRQLQEGSHPTRFGAWRRESLRRLSPRVQQLFDLIPSRGWAVSFLSSPAAESIEEALDRVRAMPAARLRKETEVWAFRDHQRPVPAWTQLLGDDSKLLLELTDVAAHVYQHVIAPYQQRIDDLSAADRALRRRQAAHGGLHALLAGLNPRHISWKPPILELAMADGTDDDFYLAGRGLQLIPSVFGAASPVLGVSAEPQPYLTYPVRLDDTSRALPPTNTARALSTVPDSLTALLGHTRAIVLWTIAAHSGCTTTELARQVGTSPASASQHATVLRSAGLITTIRDRNTALHTATRLGTSLLNTTA